ncbi:MAG TPA: PEP-CTERM sorting domain-containing protein [Myxococcota bacterium]|jgi:hypothetical protein
MPKLAREARADVLRVVLALALGSASAAAASTVVAGSQSSFGGHDYVLLTSAGWTESEADAIALGGHLVTIEDLVENQFVFDTYANFGGVDRTLWTGLFWNGSEHIWASGSTSSFRNWWPGDPNGFGAEPYVAIVPPSQSPTAAQWFDANDSGSSYSVFGVVELPEPGTAALLLSSGGLLILRRRERSAREWRCGSGT